MIEYDLVRSKRKTIGIIVKDGKVCVKAPVRMQEVQIQEFVDKNATWILSKLKKRAEMRERFSSVLEFNKYVLRGNFLSVGYTDKKRITISENEILLPKDCESPSKMLMREYKKIAGEFLTDRAAELSAILNTNYKTVLLSNARTKWGSCSSDGVLRLNWRLILLPDGIIDYVIIHELCHTKELNHSRKFWNLVEEHIPDYKIRRQKLKQFVPLIEYCR